MLEDFITPLVPQDGALWRHAKECLAKISVRTPPKPLIHTWLARQDEPGKPLGQAVCLRYLDPDAGYTAIFVSWLTAVLQTARVP